MTPPTGARTAAGTLASHLAAARGDADSLSALLAAGAPPGACDADKQTILHLAARSGMAQQITAATSSATLHTLILSFKPSRRFCKPVAEGPHMIGRGRTGIISTNHMRAFSD